MRINLLQLGTQGVDMKTNPLLLTNQKLRAATNLAFDEGVIRTRPGFRYESWGATGQFQGAGEFRPRVGISSNTLSILQGGVVVVADGEVWLGCDQIGDGFFCKGDVNVFQAENYLILQCKETSTFWWNGLGGLQESPGMNEQDWNDPEMPLQELELQAPVADIPVCDTDTEVAVIFNVVNAANEHVIPGAAVTMFRNSVKAYEGFTGERGTWSVQPVSREYTYSVSREGFTSLTDAVVNVTGQTVERVFEECMPPQILTDGDMTVNVRLMPLEPEGCFNITMTYGESDSAVVMTVENTSDESKEILSILGTVPLTTSPTLPLTVAPGTSENILITSLTPLPTMRFDLFTTCGNGGVEELEFPLFVECDFNVEVTANYAGNLSGTPLAEGYYLDFTIENTGVNDLNVTDVICEEEIIFFTVISPAELPAIVLAGNTETFQLWAIAAGGTQPLESIIQTESCGSYTITWPTPAPIPPP